MLRPYKGDLHNHTVLSPCGDIEMTPSFIVKAAKEAGYSIIGISDHNSTRQCREIYNLACAEGILVLCGSEVCTREEVHCLAFVEDFEKLNELQEYLDKYLPHIPNDPEKFGYQLWVDRNEQVLGEEEFLLISALDRSIDDVERFVHSLGGIFIPAHIDRTKYSILSQLGFMPPDLKVESLEISKKCDLNTFVNQNNYLSKYNFIRSSDAHYPEDFARVACNFYLENLTFDEVKMALRRENGRYVEIL